MVNSGINVGLDNTQVRYLEGLVSDRRKTYYDRIGELGSFLGTKILSDKERHAVKRLVNRTTFSEYELMSKLGSPEELSVWYDLTEIAINQLDKDFNVNKSRLQHYTHDSFVAGVVASGQERRSESRNEVSTGKRTSWLSYLGALFRHFSRKT